jgi:hypothetical protein
MGRGWRVAECGWWVWRPSTDFSCELYGRQYPRPERPGRHSVTASTWHLGACAPRCGSCRRHAPSRARIGARQLSVRCGPFYGQWNENSRQNGPKLACFRTACARASRAPRPPLGDGLDVALRRLRPSVWLMPAPRAVACAHRCSAIIRAVRAARRRCHELQSEGRWAVGPFNAGRTLISDEALSAATAPAGASRGPCRINGRS